MSVEGIGAFVLGSDGVLRPPEGVVLSDDDLRRIYAALAHTGLVELADAPAPVPEPAPQPTKSKAKAPEPPPASDEKTGGES